MTNIRSPTLNSQSITKIRYCQYIVTTLCEKGGYLKWENPYLLVKGFRWNP